MADFDEYYEATEAGRRERAFGRATPDNFPFVNDYRNPLLAEAMKVLGMVNKYNRGIAKVNRELEKNGSPTAQFDVNKRTEFRVTVLASRKCGPINSECGQIKTISCGICGDNLKNTPESGQINPICGTIKDECGTINNAESYDIEGQNTAVLKAVEDNPGIKKDRIFLVVQTSLRTVQRTPFAGRDGCLV